MPQQLTAATKASPASEQDARIKHLPAAAREAFARLQAGGNAAGLDPVIFAILEDFIPQVPSLPLAELPGSTRLIDDLAFDSLAITEVVFFTEDLFGISITNEEIDRTQVFEPPRVLVRDVVMG